MFSYYRHEEREKRQQAIEVRARSEERLKNRHLKTRETLTRRYDDRMNSTILQLNKEAPPMPKWEASKSLRGFLQSQGMLSEKERLKSAAEKNSWLDTTPSGKQPYRLRPRVKAKEICPPYSTRPKTEKSRLEEVLMYQRQIYDSSYAPSDLRQNWHKSASGIPKFRFSGGKDLLNYYHFKTHFKTIEHISIVDRSSEALPQQRDRVEMSRSILERYRLKTVQKIHR